MSREIEWWYAAASRHSAADEECGRPWQCACGPCRFARKETGMKTHYDVLKFGAHKQGAYSRAMKAAT